MTKLSVVADIIEHMSIAVVERVGVSTLLARAHAVLDELHAADLTPLSDEELLSYWRQVERLRRRVPTLDPCAHPGSGGAGVA
jgi:hypothetical protein